MTGCRILGLKAPKLAPRKFAPRKLVWSKAIWDSLSGWKRRRMGPELVSHGAEWSYMLTPVENGLWSLQFSRTDLQGRTSTFALTRNLRLSAAKRKAQNVELGKPA